MGKKFQKNSKQLGEMRPDLSCPGESRPRLFSPVLRNARAAHLIFSLAVAHVQPLKNKSSTRASVFIPTSAVLVTNTGFITTSMSCHYLNLFRNQNYRPSQNTVRMACSCWCLLPAVADRRLHQNLVPHLSWQAVLVFQSLNLRLELI